MISPGQNDGFHVLDDFVCDAVHAPSIPSANSAQQGQSEGITVVEEVICDMARPNDLGKNKTDKSAEPGISADGPRA